MGFPDILFDVRQAQNQDIPQLELDSFQWVISYYQLSYSLSDDVCNSYFPNVVCVTDPVTNEKHFQEISAHTTKLTTFWLLSRLITSVFATGPAPNASLTDLYFPSLTKYNGAKGSFNFDLLSMFMKYCKSLQSLVIHDDLNVLSIPINFSQSFPKLETLSLTKLKISNVPMDLFKSNTLTTVILDGNPINQSLIVDPLVVYSTSIQTLQFPYSEGNNFQFNLLPNNFPALKSLRISTTGTNVIIQMNINIVSNSLQTFLFKQIDALLDGTQFNFTINTPNIETIRLEHKTFQLNERYIRYNFVNPSSWAKFKTFITDGQVESSLPFNVTNFREVGVINGDLETFPNGVLSNGSALVLNGNKITGTIPLDIVSGNNAIKAAIDLEGNAGLTGSVPEEFCRLRFMGLEGTGVTSLPDCAYCYKNVLPNEITFDVPIPGNFACPHSLNSTFIITTDSKLTIRGKNLGYAVPGDSTDGLETIIPNELLTFKVPDPPSYQKWVDVVFSTAVGVSYNITYDYATLIFNYGAIEQIPGGLKVTLNMGFFNPTYAFNITLDNNPCINVNASETTYIITCNVPGIPALNSLNMIGKVTIQNDYTLNSKNIFYAIGYPVSTSVNSLDQYGGNVTFQGQFGQYFDQPSAFIGGENCPILELNATTLVCQYVGTPTGQLLPIGPKTVRIVVDGYTFESATLFTINAINATQHCITTTNNCTNGQGQCNDIGVCICRDNYIGDNCEFIEGGGEFKPNITNPTATFGIDGYQFNFSMVAIQELDMDDVIVREILTNNWIYTNSTNDTAIAGVESYDYKLNHTEFLPMVNARIEFSNHSRTITFGGTNQTYLPNSIKLSVNIIYWMFKSNLNHLRVVYRTQLSINTPAEYNGCGVEPTVEESIIRGLDGDNVQFLKVYKNENIFFGSFLDYVLSDGKKTYSKNELINQTVIENTLSSSNQTLSDAYIGINMPRCLICSLDPSFNSLIQPNFGTGQNEQDTCSSSDDKWKIIVGVVVGGIAAIAILVGSILYYKKVKKSKYYNAQMKSKLARLSQHA
ncbi:hypothetical protein DFA_08470 [Cavenderia fasciculata]|uniref:EGF-like domain-containing protein n=1 Tax=Cavenderia fasciculata TaxID=261658 RepID=F4Q6A0_CACFS|nr:uncharacterized protein DFA_08470 [Cavenderia fasciculata]EGG17474.1 hypothetical protein DFA_08470 [Cavenderia fasciculata]|eukprot:XP_004355958.1 hypothetical protein DFA_08470 [Cavenderia fasciculata]